MGAVFAVQLHYAYNSGENYSLRFKQCVLHWSVQRCQSPMNRDVAPSTILETTNETK